MTPERLAIWRCAVASGVVSWPAQVPLADSWATKTQKTANENL